MYITVGCYLFLISDSDNYNKIENAKKKSIISYKLYKRSRYICYEFSIATCLQAEVVTYNFFRTACKFLICNFLLQSNGTKIRPNYRLSKTKWRNLPGFYWLLHSCFYKNNCLVNHTVIGTWQVCKLKTTSKSSRKIWTKPIQYKLIKIL